MICQKVTAPEEMQICAALRQKVFVEEQKVPMALEVDGLDKEAQHFAVRSDGQVVATCRVRILGHAAKIERVAVLKDFRGKGIGAALMKYVLQDLSKAGDIHLLKLGSQIDAVPFYERLGFHKHGDTYMDAGIPHVDMTKETGNVKK